MCFIRFFFIICFVIAPTLRAGDQSFVTLSCANVLVWASPVTANSIPKFNFIPPKSSHGKLDLSSFQGNNNVLLAGSVDKFAVYETKKQEIQIWTVTGEFVGAIGKELLGDNFDPAQLRLSMYSDQDFVILNVVQSDGFFHTIVKKSAKDKFRAQPIELCGNPTNCTLSKDGRLSFIALEHGAWILMENKVVTNINFYQSDIPIASEGSFLHLTLDKTVKTQKFYSENIQSGETKSRGAVFSKQSQFLLSKGEEGLEVYELDRKILDSSSGKESYFKLKHFMKMESDLLGSVSKMSIGELGRFFAFSAEDGLIYVGTVGSYPNSRFKEIALDVINIGNKKISALDVSDSAGLINIVTDDGYLMQYLFETRSLTNALNRSLNPRRITTIQVQTPTLSAPIIGQKPGLL